MTPISIVLPTHELEGSLNPIITPSKRNKIPPAIRIPGGLSPINSKIALISNPIDQTKLFVLKGYLLNFQI